MSWFPLFRDMMEGEGFKALTPTGKLYTWFLISEYNLRGGEFYKSDLEVAETLGTSEKTVRRTRKALCDLGWLRYIPGRRNKAGQGLATRYLDVKWAFCGEDEGDQQQEKYQFSQMHRYAYEAMLACVRRKTFEPGDVVVYVYLDYWRQIKGGKDVFFITKRKLSDLTGLKDVSQRVKRLYERFQFSSGDHLFNYTGYQTLTFTNWATFADPDTVNGQGNRKLAEERRQEIKERVARKKRARAEKERLRKVEKLLKSHIAKKGAEGLPDVFYALYCDKYGEIWADRGVKESDMGILADYGRKYGTDRVLQAILLYFNAEHVPNKTGAATRTLGNFLAIIDDLMEKVSVERRQAV